MADETLIRDDETPEPVIRTKGLTRRFKKTTAVDGIDLRVDRGDVYGFIGPNGAGKTTTIRMLATLLDPSDGDAWVGGHSVTCDRAAVRRMIGYMPEDFGMYKSLLVWEYLDFYAMAYRVDPAKRKGLISDVLDLTDLSRKRDALVGSLSRGMRQRLCLAKTLVHDPEVLLLDEPASGLDPRARIEIRELIRELGRMGKTILISSHILSELSDFCTTVGIIEEGKLVVQGPVGTIREQVAKKHIYWITCRSLDEKTLDLLRELPGVLEVAREEDNAVRVNTTEEHTDAGDLVEHLVRNGVRITGCRGTEVNLEDIFMELTEGRVS
jgi:ABC-2 type transport system ATP-binding protein